MTRLVKIYILFSLIVVLTNCGFKPIYKTTGDKTNMIAYSIEFQNDPGYLIKNKISGAFNSSASENDPIIYLTTKQINTPLITNTNGTVSKYRVEIAIYFEIHLPESQDNIFKDVARGFSEYLVQTSEIQTDEKLEQAIEIATNEAIQMMSIKIQNYILQL